MEMFDEIDNLSTHSNNEYEFGSDEEDSNYVVDSDDEEYQSESEDDIQTPINFGLQFAKEMKFLEKKYSTTQIVNYHGYKFEQERDLIHYEPLLPIYTFDGNECLYKRDAFSTYQLFYSLDKIRNTETSFIFNPKIISIDDSYLFSCRKKNLAIWNKYNITKKCNKFLPILTPEDLNVLLYHKNIMNNEVQLKYFTSYALNINWISKILFGKISFNAVLKHSILTEYLKLYGIKIKKEYDKRMRNATIKDGKEFIRKSDNNRKKLCRKNKDKVKQNNNNKIGSNSKIIKTQQTVQVLEEKAIAQSLPFNQQSEGKEISPYLNIKTSFT
jgi:hypothetical protein